MKAMRHLALAAAAVLLALAGGAAFADSRIGADAGYPYVAEFLENLPIKSDEIYECTADDLREVLSLAATIHINVFEVIDCFYRWCEPKMMRIAIIGDDLREADNDFNLGGERILAILALENLVRIETGAVLEAGQQALDMYLSAPYEKYIEIGTVHYEERAGFNKMSPNLFDEAFGITVKKFFITTPLVRLELFSPGKGAIYVKAVSRPKRWNLDVVTKK